LKGLTRRRFLRLSAAGGTGAVLGIGGYSGLVAPFRNQVTRIDLTLPRLPTEFEGFKIAQLSDLHYGPFTGDREIGAAVALAASLAPDVFVATGDFITTPRFGDRRPGVAKIEPCSRLLQAVRPPLGRFAVLGNHDYGLAPDFVAEVLNGHGVRVLRNQAIVLERAGARLWLVGIDDVMVQANHLDAALAGIPSEECKVVIVHEPDFADVVAREPADLQISGHSHGGQVRMPGLRPFYLPPMAQRYWHGLYRVREMPLYVNRGIGTIGVPLRLDADPEITLFTLHSPKRSG